MVRRREDLVLHRRRQQNYGCPDYGGSGVSRRSAQSSVPDAVNSVGAPSSIVECDTRRQTLSFSSAAGATNGFVQCGAQLANCTEEMRPRTTSAFTRTAKSCY